MKYVLAIVALTVSCQTTVKKTQNEKSVDANLTQSEAMDRQQGIVDINYLVSVNLDDQSDSFSGKTQVDFALQSVKKQLFLDFKYGKVKELNVNGALVTNPDHNGFRIQIPVNLLVIGRNQITVSYSQTYTKTGVGLYRYVDPVDQSVYLYTQFQPFDAHHMFPNFDQPDMKATFKLEVEAPSHWVVVSTTNEKKIQTKGSKKYWEFEGSSHISSYLFSLHAGPYKVWKTKYKQIPIRLLARKSMASQVQPQEWFQPLIYGLKFFEDYFSYPYPFKKYDQVIVPDFNFGAMENVGAVTFSERFLRRGTKTKREKDDLAEVILHELAHMWFGNLVTMKWWDGLWLNESFASYISVYAMSKSKAYDGAWLDFNVGFKDWAYTEDEYVTTHPIEGEVRDTLSAFTNFDGITYGKGASVLKQLNFFVGEENFRNGLRNYFRSHEYGNIQTADFLNAISKESKVDLKSWAKGWLNESGIDSIKAEYVCQDQKLSSFQILQNPAGKTSRPHKTILGLYRRNGEKVSLSEKATVQYQGARTILMDLIGKPCPEFVHPNFEDHDYVKIEFDDTSMRFLRGHMAQIEDPLIRLQIWTSLNQMFLDQKISLVDFSSMTNEALLVENDERVIQKVLEAVLGYGDLGYASLRYYFPNSTPQERQSRAAWLSNLEETLWRRLQLAKSKSDFQKLWFDAFVKGTESPTAQSRLMDLLTGKVKIKGLSIDQDRRWNAIVKLAQLNHSMISSVLTAEEARDRSEVAAKQVLTAKAHSKNDKQKWLNEVLTNKDLSLGRLRAIMTGLNPYTEVDFKGTLNKEFYRHLPIVMAERDQEFLVEFSEKLAPRGCTKESFNLLGKFLRQSELPPVVMKTLRIIHQDEDRCLKIRAASSF